MTTNFRAIPSVDRLLSHEAIARLVQRYSHAAVTDLLRHELAAARQAVAAGSPAPTADEIAGRVGQAAKQQWAAGPRRVINATGVIIHTNLGRAPLSADAIDAVREAARGYSNLEYDLDQGERGHRYQHVTGLLSQLTGAEAALMVNNNASAVMMTLAAFASGKEVVISRGEAVEIGGGFRIPDVLRQSGAVLVEVGTTNRTYARDYEAAATPQTAAFLKVHASNFRVTGFTHSASLEELAPIARTAGVLLLHDLGSGSLLSTETYGLAHEPTPPESVAAGADLTCFSTDKLLGGPQGGIVVGKKELIDRLARHPLARAMRMDKLDIAALSTTLLHYLQGDAVEKVPVWRMIAMPVDELEARARRWQAALGEGVAVIPGESTVGGGSLPGETLPTRLVALPTGSFPGGAPALLARLREQPVPIIARVVEDRVVLDPRTVSQDEEVLLLRQTQQAMSR